VAVALKDDMFLRKASSGTTIASSVLVAKLCSKARLVRLFGVYSNTLSDYERVSERERERENKL
jgi:hypothetical protein